MPVVARTRTVPARAAALVATALLVGAGVLGWPGASPEDGSAGVTDQAADTVADASADGPALPASSTAGGVADASSPAADRLTVTAPPTTAEPRPVHAVRVLPAGFEPDASMTDEAVARAVAGASEYWSEQTLGRISFEMDSLSDWIVTDVTCEDVSGLWEAALHEAPEAAERGVHLVVVAPRAAGETAGCHYGYGSIGVGDSGGSTYITALHPELLAHELGHNLGLGHAAALSCPDAQDGQWDGTAWSDECTVRDYDDLYDVMGYSGEGFGGGNLSAVNLDVLGADPLGIVEVSATTNGVRLLPMSQIGGGVRVARVEVPGEPVYYAEYRTASGRDAAVAGGSWRPSTGVRILRVDPQHGGSLELDAALGEWEYDRSLAAGATFVSASGGVRISVRDLTPGAAVLDVAVGPDAAFPAGGLPGATTGPVPDLTG